MGVRLKQIGDSIMKECRRIEKEFSRYKDGKYKFTMAEHGNVMAQLAGIVRSTMALQKVKREIIRNEENSDNAEGVAQGGGNSLGKDMDVLKAMVEGKRMVCWR